MNKNKINKKSQHKDNLNNLDYNIYNADINYININNNNDIENENNNENLDYNEDYDENNINNENENISNSNNNEIENENDNERINDFNEIQVHYSDKLLGSKKSPILNKNINLILMFKKNKKIIVYL